MKLNDRFEIKERSAMEDAGMTIYMCSARIYKFGKWTFEYGMGVGLNPLTKEGDIYKKVPLKFYNDTNPWLEMSDTDKEKYRVSGGCEQISYRQK